MSDLKLPLSVDDLGYGVMNADGTLAFEIEGVDEDPIALDEPFEWPNTRKVAEQIVRAVNHFDALVAALGMCVDVLDSIARSNVIGDSEPVKPLMREYADSALALLREIRGH